MNKKQPSKDIIEPPKSSSEEYVRRAEIKRKLDKAIPDSIPPEVEGKPVKDFKLTYTDNEDIIHVIKDKTDKREIAYKQQKNDNLVFIMFYGEGRIYYDKKECCFYLYVMNVERTHIIRKYKIAEHDIINSFCLNLLEIYGDKFLRTKEPRIFIGKRLLSKIKQIKSRLDQIGKDIASNISKVSSEKCPKIPCFCLVYRLYSRSTASKLGIVPAFKFYYYLPKGVI